MKLKSLGILAFTLSVSLCVNTYADYLTDSKLRDKERAQYWASQGYDFNPQFMMAFQMDAKVRDIQRAAYWKTQGYDFNPQFIMAFQMDAAVRNGTAQKSSTANPFEDLIPVRKAEAVPVRKAEPAADSTSNPSDVICVSANLSKDHIRLGEFTELEVKVTGFDTPLPQQLEADGLQIRLTGHSTQVQMVNFKVRTSIIYSYAVKALRAGNFSVPSLRFHVDNKIYQTLSVPLTIDGRQDETVFTPASSVQKKATSTNFTSLPIPTQKITTPQRKNYPSTAKSPASKQSTSAILFYSIIIGVGILILVIRDRFAHGKKLKEAEQKARQDMARRQSEREKEERRQQAEQESKRAEEAERNAKRRSEEQERQRKQESSRQSTSSNTVKNGAYYGKVLGLKGKITMTEVKKKYREQVTQYHPDKVNHLGIKLKKLAEQEMKEINEAYDYFKRMHE